MNTNQLFNFVHEQVKLFYEKDSDLLDRNLHECCVSFRLGYYIYQALHNTDYKDLYVDAEYNRNGFNKKEVYSKCKGECELNNCLIRNNFDLNDYVHNTIDEKAMRPDLIIHNRLVNGINLLAIEIKKETNESYKGREKDLANLCYLTCERGYNYKLGLFVDLKKYSIKYILFVNGNELEKKVYSINYHNEGYIEFIESIE